MSRYQDLTVGELAIEGLAQTVDITDFTDNAGTATGYVDLRALPKNALVLGWKAVVTTGFTGDATAVIQVGVSGDLNRYSAVTDLSVLAAGTVGASVSNDANVLALTAATPRVTVTGGADFTSITAGAMTVTVYYICVQ